jgi:D-alanyl-lipoteichoic acid acyltransferase DltB (MBOAT superfamily)
VLFNSLEFILFFLVVTPLYWLAPPRLRWAHLLLASCVFYMAFVPVYILILAFTILVDYLAGRLIENAAGARRKAWLIASLFANIGVLAVFKYYNFLNDNLAATAHAAGLGWSLPALSILLPIGLSFHTFQAMSYTIEVYRGHQRAERHFGIYALYVMFYPQLVAGPIERPQNLLPQFHERKLFNGEDFSAGLGQILLGFVKKVVVADNCAVFVDRIYDSPASYSGPTLLLATVLFAFQIYADFSGYSDIALGAARVMGFRLMTNFRHPYLARSISEFWQRWHISRSTWFRDSVYIPLGGSRCGRWRWQANLLLTFLISGLWHGANWTFVIWGALNGAYLVAANLSAGLRGRFAAATGLARMPRLHAVVQVGVTFALVCLAWVFFRARSVDAAFRILATIAADLPRMLDPGFVRASFAGLQLHVADLLVPVAAAAVLYAFDWYSEAAGGRAAFERLRTPARWTLYYAGLAAILLIGRFGEQQFIYFQF